MADDERVFMLGEDIGVYGGAFGVTTGLYHRFGADRIRDTPISELGIVGAAVGAAMAGCGPIVEIQFSDFTNQAMDQIVNQAAKIHFMLGGAATCRWCCARPRGSGTGAAAQHSQSLEAWFAHVPGLKVVMPATAADAKGLLLSAIDDPNPVIVLEHKLLYRTNGEVPARPPRPLGKAAVRRTRRRPHHRRHRVMVGRSLERRRGRWPHEGVDVTVVDPRTVPFDEETVLTRSWPPAGCCWSRRRRSPAASSPRSPPGSPSPTPSTPCWPRSAGSAGWTRRSPTRPSWRRRSVPQVDDIVAAARDLAKEHDCARGAAPDAEDVDDHGGGRVHQLAGHRGRRHHQGQAVAVVMTDKVDMEVESEVEGTVTRLTAHEGDTIPVGGGSATSRAPATTRASGT